MTIEIVDFPIINGDFPARHVWLLEGNHLLASYGLGPTFVGACSSEMIYFSDAGL